nr:hypothetical protein [uncultured Roseateles sp.]
MASAINPNATQLAAVTDPLLALREAATELDRIAPLLPQLMRRGGAMFLAARTQELADLSQALLLELHMGRPMRELKMTSDRICMLAKQADALVKTTRASMDVRLSLALALSLAEKLRKAVSAVPTKEATSVPR